MQKIRLRSSDIRQGYTFVREGKRYAAVFEGGTFHAVPLGLRYDTDSDGTVYWFMPHPKALVYAPVHESADLADIDGATHAVDDGTHWHFFRGWKAEHQDLLLHLRGVTFGLFADRIEAGLVKLIEATNAVARGKAKANHDALVKYRAAVLGGALAASRKHHMGYYGENRHAEEGHLHKLIRDAMAAVKAAWATPELRADWLRVSASHTVVYGLLETPHVPQTKHQIAEAAKKAAKEAEAQE